MKIIPLRVLFKCNPETLEGIPTDEILETECKDDEDTNVFYDSSEEAFCYHYESVTHDRGGIPNGPYYQLCFRLDDIEEAYDEKYELRYDVSIRDNYKKAPPLHYDKSKKIWYQKTRYRLKDGVPELYYNSTYKKVDSISTAGIFRVIVIDKKTKQPILGHGNPSPWIYVLPSSVTISDYKSMINDLIDFNRKLVLREESVTGLGSSKLDKKDLDELVHCVKRIMKQPSEMLKKRYEKAAVYKIHSFDSRVIKDYSKTGGTGRISSVLYYEDNNTYENQVIKTLLMNINTKLRSKYQKTREIAEIEYQIERNDRALKEYDIPLHRETKGEIRQYTFADSGYRPVSKNSKYKMKIAVRRDYLGRTIISTDTNENSQIFLQNGNKIYGIKLLTFNLRNALFFLKNMCEYYDNYCTQPYNEKIVITGVYSGEEFQYHYNRYNSDMCRIDFSSIQSFNGTQYDDGEEISLKEYFRQIESLCKKYYCFIDFEDNQYNNFKTLEQQKKELEAEKNINDLNADITCLLDEIGDILNGNWFIPISTLGKDIQRIRRTPKFLQNSQYQKAYKLLIRLIKRHPYLTGEFDNNSFGINETSKVYEYWTFHKLLIALDNLGFKLSEEGIDEIRRDFDSFLGDRKIPGKMNYKLKLYKILGDANIEIEFGYDVEMNNNDHERRPDYYLKMRQGNKNYWYFMDAKYNTFSADGGPGASIFQMIYDVSIVHYIHEMQRYILADQENCIKGSFIIASEIREKQQDISYNGRLFGGNEGILSKDIQETTEEDKPARHEGDNNKVYLESIDNEEHGLPCHRYGAIKLTPNYDEELKTLLLLIFEYLQTDAHKRYKERHKLLDICWECGSDQIECIKSLTAGGYTKYYITCKKCKAFRVENHCSNPECGSAIIKHAIHNFHRHDVSVPNPKWAYLCPCCGRGVSNRQAIHTQDEDEASILFNSSGV